MSLIAERCARLRENVTLEALFDALNWDIPNRGRIRCIWPDHEDHSPAMQVYRETNSVYCFACGKGGDVVEVLWKAGNPDGGEWQLDEALDWGEKAFGLSRMSETSSLKSRLRRKLSPVRNPAPLSRDPLQGSTQQYFDIVRSAFANAERQVRHPDLELGMPIKDYIWSVPDEPGADLAEWAVWARQMVFGSYAKMLSLPLPIPPPDVVDDRPEAVLRAHLWEHHLGIEFHNPWPSTNLFDAREPSSPEPDDRDGHSRVRAAYTQ